MIRTLFATLTLILAMNSVSTATSIEERVVDRFIVPAYMKLSKSAADVNPAMRTLCERPGTASLTAARTQFEELIDAWGYAEIIRFGPVTKDNRLERILFWPDRKSIGLKQIQRVIAQKDETATETSRLSTKSVALQGLGALEFVLYGTGSEQLETNEGAFRCRFGLTISEALATTAHEILSDWQAVDGYRNTFVSPSAKNENFRDHNETLREIIGVAAHGPGIIYDARMKKYLGEDPSNANPKSALFWRSEMSFKSIAANLRGLHDFIAVAEFETLLADEQGWIAESYKFEAKNGIRATDIARSPLEAAIGEERSKLEYLSVVLASMTSIANEDLAQALGQSTGFSSLDGD